MACQSVKDPRDQRRKKEKLASAARVIGRLRKRGGERRGGVEGVAVFELTEDFAVDRLIY